MRAVHPMLSFSFEPLGARFSCMASWPMMNKPVCTNVLNKMSGINVESCKDSRLNERQLTSVMSQIAVIIAANTKPNSFF